MCGPAFRHLVDLGRLDAVLGQVALGARGRDHLEAERAEQPHRLQDARLVGVAHRDEHGAALAAAACRRRAGSWRRRRCSRGRAPSPRRSISFPGRARCRPSPKRANGNTASLTPTCVELRGRSFGSLKLASVSPAMIARRDLGDRQADHLGDERHRARGARVDFEHVDVAVLDGVLHVHQAADVERQRERAGLPFELGDGLGVERMRRQRAGASRRNGCRPPRCAP